MLSMNPEEFSIFDVERFSFGKKFGILGRLYLSVLSKQLKELGLDRHFSVLVVINELGENCCQKFIADALHVDKAMMVSVLDDLTEKGFIKRTQNPEDRRKYWISLTPKGKKSIPLIWEKVDNLNKAILKELSEPEAQKFHKHLKSIYANLMANS
jgi:DNA-binding MarR family transcriptional regulator